MEQLADPWAQPMTTQEYERAIVRPVVDSKTAAHMLGVTEAHLRQLVKRGHLSRVGKEGKRATFNAADVWALQDKRASGVSRVTTPSAQYDDPK